MDLFLDPTLAGMKTEELFDQIRAGIVSGRLVAGDRLPPSRQVAAQLGIARSTVTTVYGRLTAEGFIEGRSGAGSYVCAGLSSESGRVGRPAALQANQDYSVDVKSWSNGEFGSSAPRFDLRTGRPDPALFPLTEWRRCMTTALQLPPGGYAEPEGNEGLRRALAHWVGRSRAVEADASQVLITAGAQQAIDLITRLLVKPGQTVVVEDPGYPPVAALFAASGAKVIGVPVDGQGIVVTQIPEGARLIYTTPSHQSPSGATMSLARRRQLLDYADRNGSAIIEDDYDSEYRHSDRPLEPLYRLDHSGRVLYVGTFSKTLSPSLRLGFVVLPDSLVGPARRLRALIDWQPPEVLQLTMLRFIVDGHLERHLRRTRKVYSERHALVLEAVERGVTSGVFLAPYDSHAGLHIRVPLTDGLTEARVHDMMSGHGVAFGNLAACWRQENPPEGIIIGFGGVPTDDLQQCLGLLNQTLTDS